MNDAAIALIDRELAVIERQAEDLRQARALLAGSAAPVMPSVNACVTTAAELRKERRNSPVWKKRQKVTGRPIDAPPCPECAQPLKMQSNGVWSKTCGARACVVARQKRGIAAKKAASDTPEVD